MNLILAETVIRWMGGLLAYSTLGMLLYGVWRGTQRQVGRRTGFTASWLRSPWFYLSSSILFFGIAYLGWIRLPWEISSKTRVWMLLFGSLMYFSGIAFTLWGRLVLGKNYFVSTGLGAELFEGHQLITSGPYALVRHPIYSGVIVTAFGGLLIYVTWTTLYFTCFAPLLMMRAFREEKALAAEFGEPWRNYCRRVPMFLPRFTRQRRLT